MISPQDYSQNRSFQHRCALQVLQQYIRWEEGDTVMDVGCGTGEICKYISQQPGVASVVGLDLLPDWVSHAREHNSAPNVLFHVADATDVSTIKPEWKGAFSKVVSISVLQWIQDKAAALKVIHSCLKPGGEMVFVCDSEECKKSQLFVGMTSHPKWEVYLKDLAGKIFPWPASDLTNEGRSSKLMEEGGFEVLSCRMDRFKHEYGSVSMRAMLLHLKYIPQDMHDEFLDDFRKRCEDLHLVPGEDGILEVDLLVVHARKL